MKAMFAGKDSSVKSTTALVPSLTQETKEVVPPTETSETSTPAKVPFFKRVLSSLGTMGSGKWKKTTTSKFEPKDPKEKKATKPKIKLPLFLRILLFPIINPLLRYGLLVLLLTGVIALLYILRDLPSPRRLTSGENFAVSTQIFDRKGRLLYEIFADENRIPISISTLPPHVYQAAISIEDKNFYKHFGFDIVGITRAARNTLQGKRLEGGSTITQQLVKNALLTRERSLQRKVKEGVLAVATEAIYSKEEILEMYLNYIPYGGTAVGIESAAQRFFDKPAKELTIAEAAILAGLPQSPSQYSPYGSTPELGKQRQQDVLRRMLEDGYITQEQQESAEKEVLKFAISKTDIQAPHFVFFVRDLLYQKYGEEKVETGGLRVHTTLDLDLQNTAQASVAANVADLKRANVGNGASLIVKPNTGEILAMIGSKDYFNTAEDGQVNVTIRPRQPGSSIKPIMYATAFQEKLLNPGSYLLDIPTCFSVPGQKPYCPKNYDGTFKGPVSIRNSLGNSLNIPAVKGLKLIGLEKFINQATKMGITSWKDPSNYGLSLTLGGGEVKMIDLAQAFSVVANQGVKVPLTPITKIEDYKGNLVEEVNFEERKKDLDYMTDDEEEVELGDLSRVMDRAPAYLTSHIMQDNAARTGAFGARSKLVIPNQVVSVKTGTTNDLKDNWTVGFTPEFLVITWVGNNDGSSMNRFLVSGVTGAAPMWNDIMSFVLKDKAAVLPEKPDDVTAGNVCVTGMPPSGENACTSRATDLYWKKSRPSAAQYISKEIWVRPETGLPPNPGESMDGLVLQMKSVLADPFTAEYCEDCARPVDDQGRTIYEQQTVKDDEIVIE
jgi:penicillin-binding protein 1C